MRRLFGGCLAAAGILIAGASGLCSIGLLMNGIMVDPLRAIGAILAYGGIPFAMGIGLAIAGQRMIRGARADADDGAGVE